MAYSLPWTAVAGDRSVTSEQQRAMNAAIMANGVLKAFAGAVAGTTLTITAGAAVIEGAYFDIGGIPVALSLSSIVGGTAVLMARHDLTARGITLIVTANAPVRAGGVWDLPLATMTYNGTTWSQPTFSYEWAFLFGAEAVGTVKHVATATIPDGWLACDGAVVSRATYARLFAAIGTTFGAGDGSTTFALPNLKGRVMVSRDASQGEFDVLGETGGAKTHTLTEAQMPAHDHSVAAISTLAGATKGAAGSAYQANTTTGSSGGGQAHNNLQPYIVLNACIRA